MHYAQWDHCVREIAWSISHAVFLLFCSCPIKHCHEHRHDASQLFQHTDFRLLRNTLLENLRSRRLLRMRDFHIKLGYNNPPVLRKHHTRLCSCKCSHRKINDRMLRLWNVVIILPDRPPNICSGTPMSFLFRSARFSTRTHSSEENARYLSSLSYTKDASSKDQCAPCDSEIFA